MAFLDAIYFKMKIILFFMLAIHHSQAQGLFLTSIESLCKDTFYSEACVESLSQLLDSKKKYEPLFIYNISLQISITEVLRVSEDFSRIRLFGTQTCLDFLSLALYNLNMSLPTDDRIVTARTQTNFRTWLSAARADVRTCLDEFEYAPEAIRERVAAMLEKSTQLVTTSLGIISKIDVQEKLHEEPSRLYKHSRHSHPSWMPLGNVKPDVVVAGDGSGDYRTIKEAITAVPARSDKRFIIYVKKGIYNENVMIGVNQQNIFMYGDGMNKSIVSSNRSNATGSSTRNSATFAVQGSGFIAMDMGFLNTAGPANGQAVALFSASDKSVFYRCLVDGYQDTLLTHSQRQFYRECNIYGTVDYIFGDAASENLDGIENFLGRPWKNYSTTVIMESYLDSIIDPKGWRAWGQDIPVPDTILYVEYNNVGPGAVTKNRVHWKGVKTNDTRDYARNFTVRTFLDGCSWLPQTGVPFQADLSDTSGGCSAPAMCTQSHTHSQPLTLHRSFCMRLHHSTLHNFSCPCK